MFFHEFSQQRPEGPKPEKLLREIQRDLDEKLDLFGVSRNQLIEGPDLLSPGEKKLLTDELERFKEEIRQLESTILDPEKTSQHRRELAAHPRDHRLYPI